MLAVAVAAGLAVWAVAPAGAEAEKPTVEWGACPKDVPKAASLECSTLEVPLDYDEPDGGKIPLEISRLASTKPEERRGVLLTNPGGPGFSGLDYPAVLADAKLPQQVLDTYDVIGFAPRGVNPSTSVTCDLTPEQQARRNLPSYAHTAADVEQAVGNARTIAEQCADSSTGWLLPHLTTANTARDMDRIRQVLGEPKLSYLGHSYGTYLGAVYATMFPERGDRIVLDSNLGPGGYDSDGLRMIAAGMEERFPDFAEYAAAHPEYGLGTTPEQVRDKYFDLAERLEEKPVQDVDGTLFRGITIDYLYSDALFPVLAETWKALDTDRPLPPGAPVENVENAMSAYFSVICGDSRWPTTVREYQRNAALDRERYPMLGGSTANIGPCAFWPDERPEPPVNIGDDGPSNVLMVQNERDPGTPLAGAKKLRRAFGDRATMVTVDQGGHGVYPFGGNTCANDTVTAYLTAGRLPAQDLACAAEPGG